LHSPPHLHEAEGWFLITAATYEHKHYFTSEEDREWLLGELFKELGAVSIPFAGWVVLPNHYHLLVQCNPLAIVSEPLRRVHARTARELVESQSENVRQALEAVRQAELRYREGLVTELVEKEARLGLTQARTNLAQALFEVLPRDLEDWKLVNALLGERQTLRAEGKRTAYRDAQQLLFRTD